MPPSFPPRRSSDLDDMPFLLHLVRLDRLGGLHQRLHGAWTSCLKRRAPPSRDGANGWANTECVPEVKRLRGLASGYYDTGAVESGVRGVVDPFRARRTHRHRPAFDPGLVIQVRRLEPFSQG